MKRARQNARQRGLEAVRKATATVAVAGLVGVGGLTALLAKRQSASSATKTSPVVTPGPVASNSGQSNSEGSSSDDSGVGVPTQDESSPGTVAPNPSTSGSNNSSGGTFTQPYSPPQNAGGNGGMVVSGGS